MDVIIERLKDAELQNDIAYREWKAAGENVERLSQIVSAQAFLSGIRHPTLIQAAIKAMEDTIAVLRSVVPEEIV